MPVRFLRSLSLEAKFVLLIALVSLPVLTAVSAGALYFVKERSRHYEQQSLGMAAELLRLHLANFRNARALSASASAEPEALRRLRVGVTVRDAQGRDLLNTVSVEVPEDIAAEAEEMGMADWKVSAATSFRVYAGAALLGDGTPVRFIMAQNVTTPSSVQHAYQNVLMVISLAGGMMSVALASMLAQRGLEPLRRLAHKTRDITASSLHDPLFTRLDADDAPAELRELAQGLNDMLQRLQGSFRRLDEFSSDLAHELRTPIGNILGQSEVALSRARSVEEYRAVLESNVEELQRLSRMIQDMLFLAQSDSAEKALTRERVDLREQADKVLEYYEPLLQEKQIRVRRSGDGVILANRLLVQRAVANLLSNAVRHAPAGTELQIAVSVPEPGWRALKVSNAGGGIAAEDLPWIFQRFFRGDGSRQARGEGWGLGLAIVKVIMDMHAGRVKAQSDEDRTSFTLLFPESGDGSD